MAPAAVAAIALPACRPRSQVACCSGGSSGGRSLGGSGGYTYGCIPGFRANESALRPLVTPHHNRTLSSPPNASASGCVAIDLGSFVQPTAVARSVAASSRRLTWSARAWPPRQRWRQQQQERHDHQNLRKQRCETLCSSSKTGGYSCRSSNFSATADGCCGSTSRSSSSSRQVGLQVHSPHLQPTCSCTLARAAHGACARERRSSLPSCHGAAGYGRGPSLCLAGSSGRVGSVDEGDGRRTGALGVVDEEREKEEGVQDVESAQVEEQRQRQHVEGQQRQQQHAKQGQTEVEQAFGVLARQGGWVVRSAAVEDMRAVAAVQAVVFHEPAPLPALDGFFLQMFKAEVYGALMHKTRSSPPGRYSCLIAVSDDEGENTDVDSSSSSMIVGVVDAAALNDASVLKHLRAAGMQPADDEYLYLTGMAVDKSFRRQRIGLLLLTAVEELAQRRGFDCLVLHVHEDNDAARCLYDQAGYRPIHRDPQWSALLPGMKLRLMMAKQLPPPT